ncbi:BNR-4 repeat-containing protein [Cerasicoccus fimbriatus]|uniref:BNR-4 repeat-containing protein n=1 Tax=Cerasicoccus fimbriatus TaxID=3014554 RepID=UPI0022B56552|nr:BNR-4 repeat-containing protein [Cerasicoccus sp. TK19100]
MPHAPSFARHGSEKMIYDIRMGPQCIHHEGEYFAAYQANPKGGKALPHIIKRGRDGQWSEPVVLGDVKTYDHHLAPVIWLDAELRIHALYHCHITAHESVHVVSKAPLDITQWEPAPPVAPSISYPSVFPLRDGRVLLFHRPLGHMGYWTYQVSSDGGFSWRHPARPLVDFDRDPKIPGDDWAGSYHSAAISPDGQRLCLAFVYWDERLWPHPRYGRSMGHRNRCHLYYAELELASGELRNIDGELLPRPLNRKQAEQCLVWDTGDRLTNMPAISFDAEDSPCLAVPLSESSPQDCAFWFIRRESGQWRRTKITDTNDTWNAAHLERPDDKSFTAWLVVNDAVTALPYGGGELQEWRSADKGETWARQASISPSDNYLCNNPRPVIDRFGQPLPRTLLFFGWPGPHGICQAPDGTLAEGTFTGEAFLWREGQWL